MEKNIEADEIVSNKESFNKICFESIENQNNKKRQEQGRQQQQLYKIHKKTTYNKWTNTERIRYLMFVISNKSILENKDFNEKHGIFVKMSKFIETRGKICCSFTHTDLFNRHKSIEGIVKHLQRGLQIDQDEVNKQRQRMIQFIKQQRIIQNTLKKKNKSKYNKKSMKCQSINQQIYLNAEWNKLTINVKQQNSKGVITKYFNVKIPREITLIIKKNQRSNNQRKSAKQKTERVNTCQRVESKQKDDKKIFQEDQISNFKSDFKKKQIDNKTIEKNNQRYLNRTQFQQQIDKKSQFQQSQDQLIKNQQNEKPSESKFQETCKKNEQINKEIKIGPIWQKFEEYKFILFLIINRQVFESKDRSGKFGIIKKISQYIDTGKTEDQCRYRLNYLRKKYKDYKIGQIIDSQAIRLNISQQMIETQINIYQLRNIDAKINRRYDIKLRVPQIIHYFNQEFQDFDRDQRTMICLNNEITITIVEFQSFKERQSDTHNQSQEQKQLNLQKMFNTQQNRHQQEFSQSKLNKQKRTKKLKSEHQKNQNTNSIKQKLIIEVCPRAFKRLLKAFKSKSQRLQGFHLIDSSQSQITTKGKIYQSVKVVFGKKQQELPINSINT